MKENNLLEFEDFQINLSERTLWYQNELIPLAPKVMETLCLLVENHGRLMTKDELMSGLWGETFVEERNLTQNIFTLRKTLGGSDKGKQFIETVPRRGYRFVANVRPVEFREEVVQVSHSKQTSIKAEGYVSAQQLTEAVKEIARDLILEKQTEKESGFKEEKIQGKPFPSTKSRFPAPLISAPVLSAIVLSVLAIGTSFWFWQKNSDSRQSVFASDLNAASIDFQRITDSGKAFFPAVSPDNQFIAYVVNERNKYSIHLKHLATGSVTVALEPTDVEIGAPFFSADGSYIFYRGVPVVGGSANIYQVPIFGGSPRIVVSNVISGGSISPDGARLSFFRYDVDTKGTHLIVCRSDGSDEKVITKRSGKEHYLVWGHAPFWSPDGTKIGAVALTEPSGETNDKRSYYFVEIDIEEETEKVIPSPQWNLIYRTIWMPDGKSLMALVQEKPNLPLQVWQIAYPSGQARRITNDSNHYNFISSAPDGSFLMTTQERTFFNLWLISADNPAQLRQLTFSSELKHGIQGLEWTPDGKKIVYPLVEGLVNSNLWTIDVETLERRQLTFDQEAQHRYPNVTPDGNSVIFTSNRTGEWHIWQIDLDGKNLRQIVDDGGEFFPSITPDGKWLLYSTPGEKMDVFWKKSLNEESKPVKLRDHARATRAVSLDSKQAVVSYVITDGEEKAAYKYGIISLETGGEPEDLGFNPYFGAICWKKDGSGFYYVKDLGINLNNIWFYAPKTKTHNQITDFQDRMLSLDLSPDGKTLATARGSTVNNIFKVSRF